MEAAGDLQILAELDREKVIRLGHSGYLVPSQRRPSHIGDPVDDREVITVGGRMMMLGLDQIGALLVHGTLHTTSKTTRSTATQYSLTMNEAND